MDEERAQAILMALTVIAVAGLAAVEYGRRKGWGAGYRAAHEERDRREAFDRDEAAHRRELKRIRRRVRR